MTNRYMTLTLGRDLCYAGTQASGLSALEAFVKSQSIDLDGGDSLIFYSVSDGLAIPRAIGVALADSARIHDLDAIDINDPGEQPGGFRLPPGKYGFVQLQSDADAVIESERLELLEYMEEKKLEGERDSFFVRTITEEDGKEVYQILIRALAG